MDQEERLFDAYRHPNDIFIVPTQSGADPEDQSSAMIGDATDTHVGNLGNKRVYWEGAVLSPDGRIFSFEPNMNPLADERDLDKDTLREKVEAISEDALDYADISYEDYVFFRTSANGTIPYEEWETHPQMWNAWEFESTPKDKARYRGTIKGLFYDSFPESHPRAEDISRILQMLNKPLSTLNAPYDHNPAKGQVFSSYWEFVRWVIQMLGFDEKTDSILNRMLDGLQEDSTRALFLVENALHALDRLEIRRWQASQKKLKKDEWDIALETVRSYKQLKVLGMQMHNSRKSLSSRHWQKYFDLKKQMLPAVIIREQDVNRAFPHRVRERFPRTGNAILQGRVKRPYETYYDIVAREVPFDEELFSSPEAKKLVNRKKNPKLLLQALKMGALDLRGKTFTIPGFFFDVSKVPLKERQLLWAFARREEIE